jgi:hypothetical protein
VRQVASLEMVQANRVVVAEVLPQSRVVPGVCASLAHSTQAAR